MGYQASRKEAGSGLVTSAAAITPNDGTDLAVFSRKLFFSATAAQTLKVDMVDGGTITFTFGAAGTYEKDWAVKRVYSTGTTVTGIVALW